MIRMCIVFLCILTLSSCAHKAPLKTIDNLPTDVSPKVTGSVLNAKALLEGGTLALVPFKAGPQAEDNEELDRLSMMILKGIKESLAEKNSSLRVVDATDNHPKIALQGYVQEYSKSGRMTEMMMRPNQSSLVLVGEVWLVSTGERLLNFNVRKKFNPNKQKPSEAAYDLGHQIGDYVAAHAK